MALVLRKAGAGLTKNVSLLRSIKGRSFASATTNKKNTTPLLNAAKKNFKKNAREFPLSKLSNKKNMKPLKVEVLVFGCPLSRSMSCPSILSSQVRSPTEMPPFRKSRSSNLLESPKCCTWNMFLDSHFRCSQMRALSVSSRKVSPNIQSFKNLSLCACSRPSDNTNVSKATSNYLQIQSRSYAKSNDGGCPCPLPCGPCGNSGGCNCLPPPCNTPPKCVQYMTGYYYYPYGTWFCGPYHVSGTCKPFTGPISPGNACGPAACNPPCPPPCGPCGPPCPPCGPCKPCSCPPCKPCGPCCPNCCAFLGVCGMSHGNNPYYNPFQQYDNYNYPTPYMPSINWESNPQFGPSTWTPSAPQFYPPTGAPSSGYPAQANTSTWQHAFDTSSSMPIEVEHKKQQNPRRKCSVVWPLPKHETDNINQMKTTSLPSRPSYLSSSLPSSDPVQNNFDTYPLTQNPRKPNVFDNKTDPMKAGLFPDIKCCYVISQRDRIRDLIKIASKLIMEDVNKSQPTK